METYNFELMTKSDIEPFGIEKNGWTILMYKMDEEGAFYDEYPPTPYFYKVQKVFYPNGNIKSLRELPLGASRYFDEQGNILKDKEEIKMGKIQLDDLLKFIEKEGWINLETGEGREHALLYEGNRYQIIPSRFSIGYLEENPYWEIRIIAMPYNDFNQTIYHIDKDTGEVLYKHSEKIIYKK